ncbi:MAG: tetratricopeptide repeat protein [Gammaproteobacteria bacterium]
MSDDDWRDNVLWGFIQGIIIGWILFGVLRLLWWILKGIWWVLRLVYLRIRGRRDLRRVTSFQEAEQLEAEGDLDEAADMYRALVNSPNPSVAGMAAYSLGSLLEESEQWDEAVSMYERAMSSRDSEVVPLATLGLADALYFGKGDDASAEAIYRHLLRPSSLTLDGLSERLSFLFVTTAGLVHLLSGRGQDAEAEAMCRGILENRALSAGDRLGATVGLARILAKQGKHAEALDMLNHARTTNEEVLGSLRRMRRPLFRAESVDAVMQEISPTTRPIGQSA